MSLERLIAIGVAVAVLASCGSCEKKPDRDKERPASSSATTATPASAAKRGREAPSLTGSSIARSADGAWLFIADEDHKSVRMLATPRPILLPPPDGGAGDGDAGIDDVAAAADASAPGDAAIASFTVPGAPAQVLTLDDGRVLVTIRDPGMLFILKPELPAGLVEDGRVALPGDAWGIAITADEKLALVTSAWTHQVSAIDLAAKTKRWSIDVPREPRGVVVRADGASAYVTHLVGSDVTRIDDLASATPKVHAVALPPAPERAPSGKTLHASLGYAAAISADGKRFFVARHALGALGSWFGASTVDVLATSADVPVLPKHTANLPADSEGMREPIVSPGTVTQPRAMIYRRTTRTLLVASEGNDDVSELDGLSAAPAEQRIRVYTTGRDYQHQDLFNPFGSYLGINPNSGGIAERGAAPSGMAISEDERWLYVYCAGSHDVVTIKLDGPGASKRLDAPNMVHIADDSLRTDAGIGRRFFLNASDPLMSGGLACSACHPEGRDDGMVWHQIALENSESQIFIGEPENGDNVKGPAAGYPRQTPMLAGRLSLRGPYGWHGEANDLDERLRAGFQLHRGWELKPADFGGNDVKLAIRVRYLSAFVREGLVPPPREERELTEIEQKGHKIFLDPNTQCARCHVPGVYTDNSVYPMPSDPPLSFVKEESQSFKTPSLKFVAGTAPYFHDGRAATLEELIAKNNDKMGHTNQLSDEERAALVAYLKTL